MPTSTAAWSWVAVDGNPATVRNPATGRVEINVGQVPGVPGIPASFRITEYLVALRGADGTLPPALAQLFAGPDSWLCTSPAVRRAIAEYGFLPLGRDDCGQASGRPRP